MTPPEQALAALPPLAVAFMLVLCRCGAVVMLLPGLGEAGAPTLLRAALAGCLAVLLLPAISPALPPIPDAPLALAALIAGELAIGAALGWFVRLVALALQLCGQVIASMTGLTSVLIPDTLLGAQNAAPGALLGMAAPVLVLATGLYAGPIATLADSYATFPPGAAVPLGDLARAAAHAADGTVSLGLRLAAPFVLAGVLWQVAVGLIARLVPQLQIWFAALPGQVLGGLLLLALLGGTLLRAWLAAAGSAGAGAFAAPPSFTIP